LATVESERLAKVRARPSKAGLALPGVEYIVATEKISPSVLPIAPVNEDFLEDGSIQSLKKSTIPKESKIANSVLLILENLTRAFIVKKCRYSIFLSRPFLRKA
jgi:hypothetical protein